MRIIFIKSNIFSTYFCFALLIFENCALFSLHHPTICPRWKSSPWSLVFSFPFTFPPQYSSALISSTIVHTPTVYISFSVIYFHVVKCSLLLVFNIVRLEVNFSFWIYIIWQFLVIDIFWWLQRVLWSWWHMARCLSLFLLLSWSIWLLIVQVSVVG